MDLQFLVLDNGPSDSIYGYFQTQLTDSIPIQSNLNITLHRSKDIFNILCNLLVNPSQARKIHLPNNISQGAP